MWVYESIVRALPGANLSPTAAITLQLALFEVGVLLFAWGYGLWNAAAAGTAAVFVAAVGSYLLLRLGDSNRTLDAPTTYTRLLFGSSIEVVLAVLAFIALVTHLFVYDPQHVGETLPMAQWAPIPIPRSETPLVTALFGPEPPVPVVFLSLLVLWDVCYRIGVSWWIAVVSLYGELRLPLPPESGDEFRRIDYLNVAFALAQLVLVPFIRDRPALLLAVCGHVLAVFVVSGAAVAISYRREAA
ncbi:DUF7530 family protein [Candidatus Halobonum tyrrellensis]|uniref:DUF7530 family protein n=1 Tax=Candidatus Halobonum tyrrellensis TaxID=1431545 RepID=UPI00067792CF|nr:hypothetical protein [Candidatus Halobonum tyrrellensis]